MLRNPFCFAVRCVVPAAVVALSGAGGALAEAAPLDTFGLVSMFVEPDSKCLEANPGAFATQTDCDYNEAQYWRALPAADDSYFQLSTEATPGLCLQALPGAGGAQMAACSDEPGQRWLFTDAGVEYYYRLQNHAGGGEACLEGNRVAPGAYLDGAAFLDGCNNVSGQLWRVPGAVPVNGIPIPLEYLPE